MGIVAAYAVPHPPLIVPAVGRGQERGIQDTIDAYREVARRIAAYDPETVVVLSPHAPLYRDCFYLSSGLAAHGDMGRFGAPSAVVDARCDEAFSDAVAEAAAQRGVPVCGGGRSDGVLDHATFIPLHFVNGAYAEAGVDGPAYRLVRIGLSGLAPQEHRELGRCIADAARGLGRRTVLVASGDLSHKLTQDGPYGFAKEGPVFDGRIAEIFAEGDLDGLFAFDDAFREAAAECGLGSFQIMAGALEGVPVHAELLSYEGPFGVGYAVAAFEPDGPGAAAPGDEGAGAEDLAGEGEDWLAGEDAGGDAGAPDPSASATDADAPDPYVALARASVEHYVRTGRPLPLPDGLPPELAGERAGVFVSLHKGGDLRGCIGTIEPVRACVAEEVVRNGIAAATEDPRFPPVAEDELDELSISVDVLFPAQPAASPDELDPARYGVIVTKGWKRGLLLPNLEGVDTVADQVAIAKRKAGIDPADTDVALERFEVVRHERGGEPRHG